MFSTKHRLDLTSLDKGQSELLTIALENDERSPKRSKQKMFYKDEYFQLDANLHVKFNYSFIRIAVIKHDKNEQEKNEYEYYLFDTPMGAGSFGSVFKIIGKLKLENGLYQFSKTKHPLILKKQELLREERIHRTPKRDIDPQKLKSQILDHKKENFLGYLFYQNEDKTERKLGRNRKWRKITCIKNDKLKFSFMVQPEVIGDGLDVIYSKQGHKSMTLEQLMQGLTTLTGDLARLHALGIHHNDIKLENIIMDVSSKEIINIQNKKNSAGNGNAGLIDLGLSDVSGELAQFMGVETKTAYRVRGNPLYASPEKAEIFYAQDTIRNTGEITRINQYQKSIKLAAHAGFDKKCDVYSLGITLRLLCGDINMETHMIELNKVDTYEKLIELRCCQATPTIKFEGIMSQLPADLSKELMDVLMKMTAFEPADRISSSNAFLTLSKIQSKIMALAKQSQTAQASTPSTIDSVVTHNDESTTLSSIENVLSNEEIRRKRLIHFAKIFNQQPRSSNEVENRQIANNRGLK